MKGPRGWNPGAIERRFADTKPSSYDAKMRTVDAVLSAGAPVQRMFGTEALRISPTSVVLDRVSSGGIPVLDSHNQGGIDSALGRIEKVWFDRGSLMGRIRFNETEQGRKAEGMVARGELTSVSIGYKVLEWEIRDGEGRVIDPEQDRIRLDDDLTFTGTKWELYEASLVTVPADSGALVRSANNDAEFDSLIERLAALVQAKLPPPEPFNKATVTAWAVSARMRMVEAMRDSGIYIP